MTPRTALARAFAQIDRNQVPAIAHAAGVSSRQVANLITGRPVKAVAFLRLCTVLDHDPCPDLPHAGLTRPADLDIVSLAAGCRLRRALNKHTIRDAGKAMEISHITVSRVENAEVTSIGVVLAVCRYVQAHPYGYLAPQKGAPTGTVVLSQETIAANG